MKLTKEQWTKLEKMPIKERVERLEELVYVLQEDVKHIYDKEFEKVLDDINDESDTKCIWTICIGMILL
jgi:uncharacterized FlaG/YvyC family protein